MLAEHVGGTGEGAGGLGVIVGNRSWSLKLSIFTGFHVVSSGRGRSVAIPMGASAIVTDQEDQVHY